MANQNLTDGQKLDLILDGFAAVQESVRKHGQDIDLIMAHLGLDDAAGTEDVVPAARPQPRPVKAAQEPAELTDGPEYYEIDATPDAGRAQELPDAEEWYARVKPYEPRLGQLIRNYTFRGFKYEASKGWHSIADRALAEELAALKQDESDQYSAFVFDVVTPDEAERMEAEELGFAAEGDVRNPVRQGQQRARRLTPPGRLALARSVDRRPGAARQPVRRTIPARSNGTPVNEGRSTTVIPE